MKIFQIPKIIVIIYDEKRVIYRKLMDILQHAYCTISSNIIITMYYTGWQKMFVIFAKNKYLLPSCYPFYLKICIHNIQAISYLLLYYTSLSMYLFWSTRSRSRGHCQSTLVLNQYFVKDCIIYVVRCILTRRLC